MSIVLLCLALPRAEAKTAPTITWATPAPINAGTALSSTQLNATANVPGTFSYTPASGSIPAAGTDALSVVFTPTDTIDYSTAYATVSLVVNGPAPTIVTVAGIGTQSYSGDGGPAIDAGFFGPNGIAFDAAGNYYISDGYNHRIRKVNIATGIITTVAGDGGYGSSGDGGLATSAEIGTAAFTIDSSGNLYISDGFNNSIREVNASTGIITTIAGNGTAGYSGDGGPALSAEFNQPCGLTLSASGNLYIADGGNNVIRELNVSTGVITTVAGTGTAGFAGDGGLATAAEFNDPIFVIFDSAGNLYISDQYNSRVREVNASTGIITTVAGGGPAGYSYVGDVGAATGATIDWTEGLAFDSAGNLYVADKNGGRVRKVNKSTGIITTVAGNGVLGYGGDGGPATSAELQYPAGIAFGPHGNLFVADFGNNRIREINFKAVVSWAAPAPINAGTALSSTQLNATANVPGTFSYTPAAGSIPAAGTDALSVVFTPTDTTDYSKAYATVSLVVNGPAPIITTVAGIGTQSYSGDGGPAINAGLFGPNGIAFDAAGNYYISDGYNHRIRKVEYSNRDHHHCSRKWRL